MDEFPTPDDLCDEPLKVEAYKGAVVLTGPDGVALALTVKAALGSIDALATGIQKAQLKG